MSKEISFSSNQVNFACWTIGHWYLYYKQYMCTNDLCDFQDSVDGLKKNILNDANIFYFFCCTDDENPRGIKKFNTLQKNFISSVIDEWFFESYNCSLKYGNSIDFKSRTHNLATSKEKLKTMLFSND